jgi:hypothetical protein
LKTVLNGNRDSDAIATEQTKYTATKTFQFRIMGSTQRRMEGLTRSKG